MIYLNNAATSFPKPKEVTAAINDYLQFPPFHSGRVGFEMQAEDVITACRQKLAQLFNADNSDNIIFTSGATESLNLAILGLNLVGSHVITTAIEHNSVLRPLKTLERDGDIELAIVDCDQYGFVKPSDIADRIKRNTKAIIVNHCSNVTGSVLDLKNISDIAHSVNAFFIVDASQSAGVVPIDVHADGIDILAFAGHKSLYGIPGIGGLYLREGLRPKPLKVGGTGIRSDLLYQPEEIPMFYEAGTRNMPGIVALNAGVDFILRTGIDQIQETKLRHTRRIIKEFDGNPDIILHNRNDLDNPSTVLSLNIRGMDPADVGYILENSFHIIVRSGLHCAPLIHKALGSYPKGSFRISPSYFTTHEEINVLIEAIYQVCTAGAVL